LKVGLFGGSFDPIHRGHIEPVQEARRALALDRVLYLPTARPPHKPGRQLAPPLARYAMVELALLHEEGLFAVPHEVTPDRRAYTIDTVERFRRELPAAELYLLIGSDSFLELPHWHRWRDIVGAARLVVLSRPGWAVAAPAASVPGGLPAPGGEEELAQLVRAGRVQLLRQRPCEVSSTRLRELLARGERPPAGWLQDLVVDFIAKYDLYR
jgi:nicotinate-nucleotide adenylyltransferase